MIHIKSKYSLRLLIPVSFYSLLLMFAIKYVIEIIDRGHFLFPDFLKSEQIDKIICLFSVFIVLLFPFYLRSNVGSLEIIDNKIVLKPFLGKKRIYLFSEIKVEFKTEFTRYNMPDKYLIIRNKFDRNKFKLSKYYHKNYESIESILGNSIQQM